MNNISISISHFIVWLYESLLVHVVPYLDDISNFVTTQKETSD